MNLKHKIRNINFPDQDANWAEVVDFVNKNNWMSLRFIAPVEYAVVLENSYPIEWSYWNKLNSFDCVIVHKGKLDRFKSNYLDVIDDEFDYVFGNAVFNVHVKSNLNKQNLQGHEVHFSLSAVVETVKKLLKIGKQFKAKSQHKNILLVTANHSGNIGDDAITYASKEMLEAIYPGANIVIDKGPASKELISKVDLVVLGGGGIFYDSCFYNAQNYCQYILYASELGIRSFAIGIGAQGIMTEYGVELYRHCLDKMEFILVRDDVSAEVLVQRVKTKTPVLVNRDVVFSLKFNNIKSKHVLNKNPTGKKRLLFSLIDSSKMTIAKATQTYFDNQFECMQYLSEKYEVYCIAQSNDDLELYKKLKEKFDLTILNLDFDNTKQAMDIYKSFDLVMTSRLHGFIFAALAGVPVISVVSDNPRTKLGGLIINYIPSSSEGILVQTEYSLKTLMSKIEKYESNKNDFIASNREVAACQKLTEDIPKIIIDRIGGI